MSLTAFAVVLLAGGWSWGEAPSGALLALGSGTAFAAISMSQMANAFACRSTVRPVWRQDLLGNRLVVGAVAGELLLLLVFLGVPMLSHLLGGSWPSALGWGLAAVAALVLVAVDGAAKQVVVARALGRRRRQA